MTPDPGGSSQDRTTPGRGPHRRQRQRLRGYAAWRPTPATEKLLDQVQDVLDEYAAHLPLTVRQIFYRMVGAHAYPKNERAYKRLIYMLGRGSPRRDDLVRRDPRRRGRHVLVALVWRPGGVLGRHRPPRPPLPGGPAGRATSVPAASCRRRRGSEITKESGAAGRALWPAFNRA